MFGAPYIWGILKGTGLAGEEAETEKKEESEAAERPEKSGEES